MIVAYRHHNNKDMYNKLGTHRVNNRDAEYKGNSGGQ